MECKKVYTNVHTGIVCRCVDDRLKKEGYFLKEIHKPYRYLWVPLREEWLWIKDSFGTRLKYARECHGYSQRELSEKSGVSNAAISRYENDLQEPTVSILKALCLSLDISSDELLCLDKLKELKEDE